MKKITVIAVIGALLMGISIGSATTYAKSGRTAEATQEAVITETQTATLKASSDNTPATPISSNANTDSNAQTTSAANGKTVIMRSFYGGYILDDSDIAAMREAAQDTDNMNRKNMLEILNVIESGQHYLDSQNGIDYVIIRRKGNEDVSFELPWSTVKVYDLRGYDFTKQVNFYNNLDDELSLTGTVTGQYGSFELYQ